MPFLFLKGCFTTSSKQWLVEFGKQSQWVPALRGPFPNTDFLPAHVLGLD
jgi:hypothetical protein